MPWEANLLRIKVSMCCCFPGVIAFSVMTILSDNPLRSFIQVRHGTWQCCRNNSAKPEIRYELVSVKK